nr:BTAD domain-containing putative transcriptional regulator [Mycobacterium simiae]
MDGTPVAIPGAKPRAILTMLGLNNGSVVPADTLLHLLWGDAPPRTAAKALQTHISALRRTLGDGVVVTAGAGWTLQGADVDASRYKAAAKRGRDAIATGDTSQALACFDAALTLWRGVPELPDGQRGRSEKTRWVEGHAALVEDRADALLATGRAAEVVGDLEAAVADAPLRERRWGQLMLALYRAGRQGEALGAYQRARTLLADELGVDPGPELRRLETAIVGQDSSLDVAVAQQLPSVTRAVTFLLTDIEGSTAAWEADAEAMSVALARHDELVEQVVTSRGGRLIKTRGEGDATFSVFERPSAAAAAAIELQDAITHEPWALRAPLRIRMALHTGEVELRDGDYFGRAVNRVARLRSLAEGGQILCSGAIAELVIDSLADDVVLTDLGMRQLKNLARPEHVFELRLEAGADHTESEATEAPLPRPPLPGVLVGAGPFVGRGNELERLYSAWQTTLMGGVRAVLIAGEPGVGKTRLAGEWGQRAHHQGAVVLYGRCDEDLGAPYQPFAEALRSLVPCMGHARLRGLRGVDALLTLVPGLTDVVPDVASRAHPDPDTERYALFDAVVALIDIASASAPVLLILDDLHWAAKPTLLLLRHLLRFGEHGRVQIVGTYRSTDLDRSHPLAAMLADLNRDGTAERLSLAGLDEADVTSYVAEAGYDDEELGRALAAVTGGNPFFLIEALRHVDESGGAWDQSTLPQGVREAVSRRLSRLPVETNKALAAAAVVGSRFALDLVEQVVGTELIDAFDQAGRAGIVIEEPGGNYRFNHAIVRQSLLAELASVRRMRLHQRIATTLETRPGADDEMLAELAHHYFECAWAGNAAKAVYYCRRAADQAMTRLAYEGAADLYHQALHALEEIDEELPDRDDQTAELLVARCEALLAAGDVASAAGAVAKLQETTVDSPRLAAWATCFDGQLSMLIHPDRLDEVEAALGGAAAKLAELDDAAGEAKAHTVRASCLARLGRIADCELALDNALTAARRARDHRRVNAVLAGAPLAALWGPNPVPRAGGRCLDVVRLLRITTDSPAVEATSTRCQAVLEAFRGRAAAARRMIESARRTVTELGLRHAVLEVEQFAGIVELIVGDPAAAEPYLRKAYHGFRRMGLDADTAETAALLGRACLALGRQEEAHQLCSESEQLAGHALKASIAWRTLRAHLLTRRGDHDAARAVAEEAVTLAERTDALVDHGDACLTLATVLVAAGDTPGARTAVGRAVDLYERKGAAALAEMARGILGEQIKPPAPVQPEIACAPPGTQIRLEDEDADFRRLDNTVTRVYQRFWSYFADRDWDGAAATVSENLSGADHRRVVNAGNRGSRESVIEDLRVAANLGFAISMVDVVAIRGERLALTRVRAAGRDPETVQNDAFNMVEIDADNRITSIVVFDLDDFGSAIAELDAHYLAGEASEYAHTWSILTRAYATVNGQELPPMTPHFASTDHRRGPAFGLGEMIEQVRAGGKLERHIRTYVECVYRLNGLGMVCSAAATALSPEGVDAEWRMIALVTIEGDLLNRCEVFDETDLDAAITRFEQLSLPASRPQNAASKVYTRINAYFTARDWDAMPKVMAENMINDDRRHMANSGIRRGRDVEIANGRAFVELGAEQITSTVAATRGERLALCRSSIVGQGLQSGPFRVEFFSLVETDAADRLTAHVAFDLDDFDAAVAELDSRYLAGEAAPHARTWSVLTRAYAALNRREHPATTPTWSTIDHRHGISFAPGQVSAVLAHWTPASSSRNAVESVHRLSDSGALVTSVTRETSPEGFDAEWRGLSLLTIEGELINRLEVFDETDLDAAIARFEQLTKPAREPENAASRVSRRFLADFAAGDWTSVTEMLADNYFNDDRRRMVGLGVRHGRDAEILNLRAIAGLWLTDLKSTALAIRGERLVLLRVRALGRDQGADEFLMDVLTVLEINGNQRIARCAFFDLDDFDAAAAELDSRYLAGQAAPHARTWSVVMASYAALNRHELPPTTPNCVYADHRRETAFGPADLTVYFGGGWDLNQDINIYVEEVHRLTGVGAVVTYRAHETSPEGLDAEWRGIALLTIQDELVSRCEVFDEADAESALAAFDHCNRPQPRLENQASRMYERFKAAYPLRDWGAIAAMLADDVRSEDRRHVINAGVRQGPDAVIAEVSGLYDAGIDVASEVVAIRGDRLVLNRIRTFVRGQGAEGFHSVALDIVELNDDGRVVARLVFDLDDLNTALTELDARYLAGEAAPYAQTWQTIAATYTAVSRRELPPSAPQITNIDHRRSASLHPGKLDKEIRTYVTYVEVVHRLDHSGAVVTYAAAATSQQDFDAEWHEVAMSLASNGAVNHYELFDAADLDAALARFDELRPPAPQLRNAANRVHERILGYITACEWHAVTDMLAVDFIHDDRRRAVNSGLRQGRDAAIAEMQALVDIGARDHASDTIATRGERLVLCRTRSSGRRAEAFYVEVLDVFEIDDDETVIARVVFDPDDIDDAIAELENRYLSGEAARHARTWSAITRAYEALNRGELPAVTENFVDVDHRRGARLVPGDLMEYLGASLDDSSGNRLRIVAVPRLTDRGAVVTHVANATSREGFDAEWRITNVFTVQGGKISRCELYDVADLDAAFARFDEFDQ